MGRLSCCGWHWGCAYVPFRIVEIINRLHIPQGLLLEGAYRGFSKGNCDARFRKMSIGRREGVSKEL